MKSLPVIALTLCSLTAVVARADAAIDCKSAAAPTVDAKTYMDTCRAQATTARLQLGQAAVAAASVFDSRTTVAGANFANVPTWSDADIVAQFAATRDTRYMIA